MRVRSQREGRGGGREGRSYGNRSMDERAGDAGYVFVSIEWGERGGDPFPFPKEAMEVGKPRVSGDGRWATLG